MRRELIGAVVAGGVLAGVLDIGAAALINKAHPTVIMKAIAGGLLGPDSMKGGAGAAALGFALQLLMGVIIAAVYGAASLRFPILTRQWLTGGLGYGVVIYGVMNYGVVPLSALHRWPRFPPRPLPLVENMAAMLAFGVIVAFAVYRGATPPSG